MREYYKAYEDRYRQIHGQDLQWFDNQPSMIVSQIMEKYGIGQDAGILEIGCGEGRDAFALLNRGFSLLATDVSEAAISFCRKKQPEHASSFQVLDCLQSAAESRYDFVFAVAVIHMLVTDSDRGRFYEFVRDSLKDQGIGLICTMGDGVTERESDISRAFDVQTRIHEQSGREVQIASTSCRMVSFDTFRRELVDQGLLILESGSTAVEPDFPEMMYAVVKRAEKKN